MPTKVSTKEPKARIRRWRQARQVLSESLRSFLHEDSMAVSASIAYHCLLCIFPFLLLMMGLSGYYVKHRELAGRLTILLGRYLPMDPDFILLNLESIARAYGRVGFFSLLLLLWGSSGIFLPLEKVVSGFRIFQYATFRAAFAARTGRARKTVEFTDLNGQRAVPK